MYLRGAVWKALVAREVLQGKPPLDLQPCFLQLLLFL